LIAIMLSVGLRVSFGEIVASVQRPVLMGLGLLANFVLFPLVTLGLLQVFDPHPMVSVGFLILAACPGAPVGPPAAAIAKADVPSAIGLMVVLSGLSVILSPVLLKLLLDGLLLSEPVEVDPLAIVKTLLLAQLLPLVIGLAMNHRWPNLSHRLAKPLGTLANVLLLGAVALILVREFPTLALIRLRGWFGMLLLLAASLVLGWLCGGPERGTQRTMALTTAARNAAVALVIVSSNFAGTPAMTAVVAYSLVSIFGAIGCAILLARIPRTGPPGEGAHA
jgi:BASS family bile acid:Na+ symporter